MHQQRARLIMALLHPAAPDALVRWGFAGSVFQTSGRIGAGGYLTVPNANKVAEEHLELMQKFQDKLKKDAAFAAAPQAPVAWWIARSSYQPSAVNRHPLLKVWEKNLVAIQLLPRKKLLWCIASVLKTRQVKSFLSAHR